MLHALALKPKAWCVQLAHPLLAASGAGCIVMNSSVAGGPMAIKTGAIYAMTKGTRARCFAK